MASCARINADFTVLNRDLFTIEDEEILDAKVVMTVVAGEIYV